MKTITNKEHKFRVEITPNELLGAETITPQNYFETWLKSAQVDNDEWTKKSESAKKYYQKRYFETERIIHELDEDNQLVARFHLKLNTDWTWNVTDLKNKVKYEHCYPIKVEETVTEKPKNSDMILQIPVTIVEK